MSRELAQHVRVAALGLLFGAAIGGAGFSDYQQLRRMFTLREPRLFLVFGGAVALCALGFAALARRPARAPAPRSRRPVLLGGLLFGLGWVIGGSCPLSCLVQLGEGRLPAVVSLGGMLLGIDLSRRFCARFPRWQEPRCDE